MKKYTYIIYAALQQFTKQFSVRLICLLCSPQITSSNGYRENDRRQDNVCCTVLSTAVNREIHIKIPESVSQTALSVVYVDLK